jgi:hypothetical protein
MPKGKTKYINNQIDAMDGFKGLDELFSDSDNFTINSDLIDPEDLRENFIDIDTDKINDDAVDEATQITERLSDYYFDQKYIDEHPYIPSKIRCEMNNIRRLLKMLKINEIAQDALIKNLSMNAGKGNIYASLTALQNATLSIQTQLSSRVNGLEEIFQKMQAECEKTWSDKEKEQIEDGTIVVRGAHDFIKMLSNAE